MPQATTAQREAADCAGRGPLAAEHRLPRGHHAREEPFHAVLRREDGPDDISLSRVRSGPFPHPYLAAADAAKSVFLRADLPLGAGAGAMATLRVVVPS